MQLFSKPSFFSFVLSKEINSEWMAIALAFVASSAHAQFEAVAKSTMLNRMLNAPIAHPIQVVVSSSKKQRKTGEKRILSSLWIPEEKHDERGKPRNSSPNLRLRPFSRFCRAYFFLRREDSFQFLFLSYLFLSPSPVVSYGPTPIIRQVKSLIR